jgi:hypothetical protein
LSTRSLHFVSSFARRYLTALAPILQVFPVAQPQCCVGVDEEGSFMAVTIYNMAPDAIALEDTVIVPEPFFRKVTVRCLAV